MSCLFPSLLDYGQGLVMRKIKNYSAFSVGNSIFSKSQPCVSPAPLSVPWR